METPGDHEQINHLQSFRDSISEIRTLVESIALQDKYPMYRILDHETNSLVIEWLADNMDRIFLFSSLEARTKAENDPVFAGMAAEGAQRVLADLHGRLPNAEQVSKGDSDELPEELAAILADPEKEFPDIKFTALDLLQLFPEEFRADFAELFTLKGLAEIEPLYSHDENPNWDLYIRMRNLIERKYLDNLE